MHDAGQQAHTLAEATRGGSVHEEDHDEGGVQHRQQPAQAAEGVHTDGAPVHEEDAGLQVRRAVLGVRWIETQGQEDQASGERNEVV